MKIAELERLGNLSYEYMRNHGINLNKGQKVVLESYVWCNRYHKDLVEDYIVISDVWVEDVPDMIAYLKELNITKFVFDDSSTESFKIIKYLLKSGCKLSYIEYKKEYTLDDGEYLISGVLVDIGGDSND